MLPGQFSLQITSLDLLLLLLQLLRSPPAANTMQLVRTADGDWVKPASMDELLGVFASMPQGETYRLVAGNTGVGIYREREGGSAELQMVDFA